MELPTAKIYRHRSPESSPFFKVVSQHFSEFERVYAKKYEAKYGFWRPVIHTSVEKFLKCGDLKEGFARIKCNDCGKEMFVPFSCHQRCSCPSCHQKRSLLGELVHSPWEVVSEIYSEEIAFGEATPAMPESG